MQHDRKNPLDEPPMTPRGAAQFMLDLADAEEQPDLYILGIMWELLDRALRDESSSARVVASEFLSLVDKKYEQEWGA